MSEAITAEGARIEVNTGADIITPIWTPIAERAQASLTKSGATIDVTSFDDEGFSSFKPGLRNCTLSASGNLIEDDDGYDEVEEAWIDGCTLPGVRLLWRTSDPCDPGLTTYIGWQWDSAIVTDMGEDGSVGDKVNSSLAFQLNGRPTRVNVTL